MIIKNKTAAYVVAPETEHSIIGALTVSKRKRNLSPTIWGILTKARRKFDAQCIKSNPLKVMCIEAFMYAESPDVEKFWLAYDEQAERLRDSKRFDAECKRLGIDATILSQHIVFLGSATVNNVLKNGVESTLGKDINLYREPLREGK